MVWNKLKLNTVFPLCWLQKCIDVEGFTGILGVSGVLIMLKNYVDYRTALPIELYNISFSVKYE